MSINDYRYIPFYSLSNKNLVKAGISQMVRLEDSNQIFGCYIFMLRPII